MSSFIVAPSEAVLIGICLEEYLQARQDYEKASILDFIDSHIRSFVPDMTVYSTIDVAEADLPPDVEWTTDSRVGTSLSTQRVFGKANDKVLERIVKDQSRKTLADLLRDMVFPLAAKSPLDHVLNRPRELSARMAKLESDLRGSELIEPVNKLFERDGVDDPDAIEAEIVRLISENDLAPLFSTGRALGAILSDCHRFDWYTHNWELPYAEYVCVGEIAWAWLTADEFFHRYESRLRKLLSLVSFLPYATLIIEEELARCPGDRLRLSTPDSESICVPRIAQIRLLVGIMVGELIASLRDADLETVQKDAASATPRMFPLCRGATGDRVRGQLALIEREFSERTTSNLMPEGIVAMLGNAIEALAKTVWPAAFIEQGKRVDFGRVLDDKARSSNDLEQRFARVAQALYKQYRVPAEHEQHNFRCSCEEARFFVNGIRTLQDLAQRIKSQGRA